MAPLGQLSLLGWLAPWRSLCLFRDVPQGGTSGWRWEGCALCSGCTLDRFSLEPKGVFYLKKPYSLEDVNSGVVLWLGRQPGLCIPTRASENMCVFKHE